MDSPSSYPHRTKTLPHTNTSYNKRNLRRKSIKTLPTSNKVTPHDIFIAHLITAKSLDSSTFSYSDVTTKIKSRQPSTTPQQYNQCLTTPQLISTDVHHFIQTPQTQPLAPLQQITVGMRSLTTQRHHNFPTTFKQINTIHILTFRPISIQALPSTRRTHANQLQSILNAHNNTALSHLTGHTNTLNIHFNTDNPSHNVSLLSMPMITAHTSIPTVTFSLTPQNNTTQQSHSHYAPNTNVDESTQALPHSKTEPIIPANVHHTHNPHCPYTSHTSHYTSPREIFSCNCDDTKNIAEKI
jgi:hypothetical protein